ALEEAGDIKVLCAAAQIAIETHMLDEGNTRRMKRASYWLDDCEYRQLLERAKASVTYGRGQSSSCTLNIEFTND
ncbi:MAG: hypothetical protein Q4C03_08185, partial [bacterium]|nr:hypothetical protein [bacterium]